MNVVQRARDLIGRVSPALRDELDQIVASIQAGWNVEHDSEGHHAAITGTSATLTGNCRCGRFSTSNIIFPDVLSASVTDIWYPSGVTTAGGIFVRSSGAVTIYAITTDGRQEGDELDFINGNQSVDAISLRTNATSLSAAAGTFRADGSTPDTDYAVPCGRWVKLKCTRISPNNANAKLYWRIHHF